LLAASLSDSIPLDFQAMLYYAPELFTTLGSGTDGALVSAIVVSTVLLFGALTSILVVDRIGRRPLLIGGALVMLTFQVMVAVILGVEFDPVDPQSLLPSIGKTVLFVICLFTYAFGTSWGPLGWLVPVECQSQATRSAASTASVAVNFFAVFLTTQLFPSMLCSLKWGIFLFYAGFDATAGIFSLLLVPETKGVPIEEMRSVWKLHWFWGKRIEPQQHDTNRPDQAREESEATGLLESTNTLN